MSLIAFKVAGNTGGSTITGSAIAGAGTPPSGLQTLGSPVLAQTFPPEETTTATNPTTAVARFQAIYVPSAITATGIRMMVTAGGSGFSAGNKVGLYSCNASTGLTQIAVSSEITSFWSTTGNTSGAFITPVALTPGLYFVAWLFTGTGAPTYGVRGAVFNGLAVQPVTTASTDPKLCAVGGSDLTAGPLAWNTLTVLTSQAYVALY